MADKVKLIDCPKLLDFLNSHETLNMANPIDDEGTLHAAAMLYYCGVDPLRFYVVTARDTDKCKLLKTDKTVQCAVVIVGKANNKLHSAISQVSDKISLKEYRVQMSLQDAKNN